MSDVSSITITIKGEKDGKPLEVIYEFFGDERTDVQMSLHTQTVEQLHPSGMFHEQAPTGRYDLTLQVNDLITK